MNNRKHAKSGKTSPLSTQAARRSNGNRQRSKPKNPSVPVMASALAVVVTQKAMATLCQQRRPPLPRRTLNPSPASGTSHARPKAKKEYNNNNNNNNEISFGNKRPPPPKEHTLAPAAAAATAPTKKQPPKAESGSDVEMADDAQPRSPQKQKKSTLATKDPDLDSGDDLMRAALEKGKGKATLVLLRLKSVNFEKTRLKIK
jgi:hypothetical protein